ncbi:MAG: SIMPL domain-containing protein [Proteobacteria bacterium]|nr:SIMPL domain-containing protein [Pseudomonadota bacterium]
MITALHFKPAFALIAAMAIFSLSPLATADSNEPFPRIHVTGEGSIDIAPDMAVLGLTVMREAKTARLALDANSDAMKKVLSALRAEGIADRDLQTSNFSIQPKYVYPQERSGERKQRQIVGYTVRNSLTVRVRDIARVGAILDKSVTLGINQGGNIMFTNDDPSAAITQARTQAVKAALAKANTLATAAGVKVGKILEISEQSFPSHPMPIARAEMAMARSSDAVPMATGESTYRVNVNVSFAIEQ